MSISQVKTAFVLKRYQCSFLARIRTSIFLSKSCSNNTFKKANTVFQEIVNSSQLNNTSSRRCQYAFPAQAIRFSRYTMLFEHFCQRQVLKTHKFSPCSNNTCARMGNKFLSWKHKLFVKRAQVFPNWNRLCCRQRQCSFPTQDIKFYGCASLLFPIWNDLTPKMKGVAPSTTELHTVWADNKREKEPPSSYVTISCSCAAFLSTSFFDNWKPEINHCSS